MTAFPRDRDTICPSWCELPADHVILPDSFDHEHRRTVAQFDLPDVGELRSCGERPLSVQVHGYTDPYEREWPPLVYVGFAGTGSGEEEYLTAGEARALAAALLRAATLIE